MQTSLSELAKNKPLPSWMTKHSVFKSIDKVEKVFPSIGLQNFSELCDIKGNFAYEYAKTLLAAAKSELRQAFEHIENNEAHIDKNIAIQFMDIIEQLDELLVDGLTLFIILDKGIINLSIPKEINANDAIKFKSKYDFLEAYRTLQREMSYSVGYEMRATEKLAGYKDYLANNFSVDKSKIIFASDGVDGLWDIATMSMRGIKSCVRWDGAHKQTLIGSIADPFTSIIYLTSGKKEKLGTQMLKRCLVRFVIDGDKNKPYLLIDRMYPSLDEGVLKVFIDCLRKHTNNKFDIRFGPTMDPKLFEHSYIPKSEVIDKLTEKTFTYRDTKINIGKKPSKINERRDSNLKIKLHNFITRLKNKLAVSDIINKMNVDGNVKYNLTNISNILSPIIIDYYNGILEKIIEDVKINSDASSDEYIKRICYSFFSNRNDLIKVANKKFSSKLNASYNQYYGANTKVKNITAIHTNPVCEIISETFSKAIKEQVYTILNKGKLPKASSAKKKSKAKKNV